MMSLWSEYLRECGLLEIIEYEWGFITFHVEHPDILFINDCYVRMPERKSGKASSLVKEASEWGERRGCKSVLTTVHTGSLNATGALHVILKCGFKVRSSDHRVVVFSKEL